MTRMSDHIYDIVNAAAVVEFAESLKDPELLRKVGEIVPDDHPDRARAGMYATAAHTTLANMLAALVRHDLEAYGREIEELSNPVELLDVVNVSIGVITTLVSVLNPPPADGEPST